MKLGSMKDGRFFRNVGFHESGSQPKFYVELNRSAVVTSLVNQSRPRR